jgi:hypothetical protein
MLFDGLSMFLDDIFEVRKADWFSEKVQGACF